MSSRNNNKRPARGLNRRRRGISLSDNSINTHVSTLRFRSIPFYVDQASSGTGGLTTANSQASVTASNSVNLDPFTIGGRFYLTASDFLEYRIMKLRARYFPSVSDSGVVSDPDGPETTETYAQRSFCWGIVEDPNATGLAFLTGVEAGLKLGRTNKPSTITMADRQLRTWRYNSTVSTYASPPSGIDFRLVSPGCLKFFFSSTSTTAAQRYGFIILDTVVQFRSPVANLVPVGRPIALIRENQSREEVKSEEEKLDLNQSFYLLPKNKIQKQNK
jgi:hypothetical protein